MPKGMEWLWHPKIVHLYNSVIKSCEINAATREAAIGALQNITAGQEPVGDKFSRTLYKVKTFFACHNKTLCL